MDAIERQQMEKRHKVDEAQLKRDEATRERMISDFTAEAAEAYAKVLTRYPVMDRADDAKARLLALHQPVPRPTKAALAQNKAEEAACRQQTTMSMVMGTLSKHPDVSAATRVGEPTLVDPEPLSANKMVEADQKFAVGKSSGNNAVSVVTVGTGAPPPSEPAPRSDAQAPQTAPSGDPGTQPAPA